MQKVLLLFLLWCALYCEAKYATQKCPGKNEFYACNSDCDNECSTLGSQNRTNCRSTVKTCMCYCKDGYSRNENNVCIPNDQCKNDRCFGQNEVLRRSCLCPPERTCKNRGIMFSCLESAANKCENKCVCKKGYYKNYLGDCISNAQCDQCTGDHEFFSCGTECDNECGKIGIQNRTNCPIVNIVCNEKCYCEDGYARDVNNKCVPVKDCPKTTCNSNEVYRCVRDCPPEATCENPNPIYHCPLQKESDCCKSQCVCDKGYVRNYLHECIPVEDCNKCTGEQEFYSPCAGACDNRCSSLATTNRTNCDIQTFACVGGCYCKDGYARDDKEKCVPVDECTKGCGPYEFNMKCLKTCPPDECFALVARFKCESNPKCNPGCRCQDGFYREKKEASCMPMRKCPQMANSPEFK